MFLVYDAVADAAARGEDASYVAYWFDVLADEVFVFSRVLRDRLDVGQALLALSSDLEIDIEAVVSAERHLARSLADAAYEPHDKTIWQVGSRSLVFDLMGVEPDGAGMGVEPDGEFDDSPEGGLGSIAAGVVGCDGCFIILECCPPMAAMAPSRKPSARNPRGPDPVAVVRARVSYPPPPANSSTPDDLITLAATSGRCCDGGGDPPPGGGGDVPCGSYNCNDGNPCTSDWCNENSGGGYVCAHQPINPPGICCENKKCCSGPYQHCYQVCCPEGETCCAGQCCSGLCCPGGTCCPAASCCAADGCCGPDENVCTDDFCDNGACMHPPNNNPCEDDGNPCTDDYCINSACAHTPGNEGGACDDDGDPCTDDVCGENGFCTHPPGNDGTACENDINACTNDICDSGACTHVPIVGRPCSDDENECTDDVCNQYGSCTHPPDNEGGACDVDENECTDDVCADGACSHVPVSGRPCSDDGNECTVDVCDEYGSCTHPPLDGFPCEDDGNPCTDDVCSGSACDHPDKPDGTQCPDDGDPCTLDVCESGACTHPQKCTIGDWTCRTECCAGGVCYVDWEAMPCSIDKLTNVDGVRKNAA